MYIYERLVERRVTYHAMYICIAHFSYLYGPVALSESGSLKVLGFSLTRDIGGY